MNLLYFPTRFYPAISGAEYYMQRVAEECKKRYHDNVQILTSNAIDFAALHGNGKKINPDDKEYSNYRGLPIKRFDPIVFNQFEIESKKDPQNKIGPENEQRFYERSRFLSMNLRLSENNLIEYSKNGPILKELERLIEKNTSFIEYYENQHSFQPNSRNLIHTTYLPYVNLLYSLIIAKKMNVHSAITPFLHSENSRYQDEFIFSFLQLYDIIFACTEYEKSIYLNHHISSKKIQVIPMGVDIKHFLTDQRKEFPFAKELKDRSILFCGYKNLEKGALSLLKTIPLFNNYPKSLSFIFIGPPTQAFNQLTAKIKKELSSNVNIINITPENLSGINDKKKIAAFQLADIYCMPSRSDAYGIVYLEAWASKKPVIGAKIPAIQEVILENKDGLLVSFDNTQEIKESIEKLLNNDELRIQMGINGYNKVLQNNTWETLFEELVISIMIK